MLLATRSRFTVFKIASNVLISLQIYDESAEGGAAHLQLSVKETSYNGNQQQHNTGLGVDS